MTTSEKYGLLFIGKLPIREDSYSNCDCKDSKNSLLANFLTRLRVDDLPSLIEEIVDAIKKGSNFSDSICSDPWEDMSVGIDYDNFYIEDYRLPLFDMKNILFDWMEFIRPGAHEYFDEIEKSYPKSQRENWYLQFKHSGNRIYIYVNP